MKTERVEKIKKEV
jgi:hypothetical protein